MISPPAKRSLLWSLTELRGVPTGREDQWSTYGTTLATDCPVCRLLVGSQGLIEMLQSAQYAVNFALEAMMIRLVDVSMDGTGDRGN